MWKIRIHFYYLLDKIVNNNYIDLKCEKIQLFIFFPNYIYNISNWFISNI